MKQSALKVPRPRPGFGRVVAFVFLLVAQVTHAEPYRPRDPEAVLLRIDPERVSEARVTREKKSRGLTPELALQESRSNMQRGRSEIDERYFGQAEALLRRTLKCANLAPVDAASCPRDRITADLLVALADVLQHRHEFATAEQLLAAALERAPQDPQAHLMRANIRLANGRANEALADCKALLGRADMLIASTCIGQSIGMTGQLDRAYELITRMSEQAPAQAAADFAWVLAIRAELLERRGDGAGAADVVLRAVEMDPRAYSTRLQAADTLLRAGRATEVFDVLRSLPATEPVQLRRALASRAARRPEANDLVREWRELTEREQELGAPQHLRDLARGQLELLQDAEASLAAARENWKTQREIEDARVLLAAAAAARRPDEARPVQEWLAQNRIEDAVIDQLGLRGEAK